MGICSCFYDREVIEYKGPLFPLTSEGKDILTFLYNSNVWVNESNHRDDIKCTILNRDENTYLVEIQAYSQFEEFNSIKISCVLDSNYNQIKVDSTTNVTLYDNGFDNCDQYSPITQDIFVNVIKLDTIKRIFSGEFSIPILINDCDESITITKGRFDIKYEKF